MPDERANLKMISSYQKLYYAACGFGYSGHETGLSISYFAAALGATYIERHITLDKAMYGSDQAASLDPQGIRLLVGGLRKVEAALGSGMKEITDNEKNNAKKMRYWE